MKVKKKVRSLPQVKLGRRHRPLRKVQVAEKDQQVPLLKVKVQLKMMMMAYQLKTMFKIKMNNQKKIQKWLHQEKNKNKSKKMSNQDHRHQRQNIHQQNLFQQL